MTDFKGFFSIIEAFNFNRMYTFVHLLRNNLSLDV